MQIDFKCMDELDEEFEVLDLKRVTCCMRLSYNAFLAGALAEVTSVLVTAGIRIRACAVSKSSFSVGLLIIDLFMNMEIKLCQSASLN